MFPATLETESLRLEQFCDARVDVFELYELFAEGRDGVADVFEYIPQEPYSSVKDARDHLVDAEASWEDADSAQYAVYTTDGALAGHTGLIFEWERRTARIGFILSRQHWGHGYAGECGTALLDLAFDRLDVEVVALEYADGNDRSKRAIEKIIESADGQYDGVIRNRMVVGDQIVDHHRYTIIQEQYHRSKRDD